MVVTVSQAHPCSSVSVLTDFKIPKVPTSFLQFLSHGLGGELIFFKVAHFCQQVLLMSTMASLTF